MPDANSACGGDPCIPERAKVCCSMADLRIGISGWNYPGWRGIFYPKGLVQKRELEYASRQMNSIEINGSFYSLQRPSSYQLWYQQTPDDFVFSIKGGRFITHMKKLNDVEIPLANFFASGVLALREKLGPILWQFPQMVRFDLSRFEKFLRLLPRTTEEAAHLAASNNGKIKEKPFLEVDESRPIRYAFEIRHESFSDPGFLALLREHNAALVFADTAGKWPYIETHTAEFDYIRLHGSDQLYVSGYSESALDWWEKRIRSWRGKKRDVYVYFDNDAKVRAPFDAISLASRFNRSSHREKRVR